MINFFTILLMIIFSTKLSAELNVQEPNQIEDSETTKQKIKDKKLDESFLVIDKIGKNISGLSFARNWKDLNSKSIVPSHHEIATGVDGFSCLKTNSAHAILLLPFSRVKPTISIEKGKPHLEMQVYSGSALIYSPPDTTTHTKLGRAEMKTTNGTFYAINDRKIGKSIFGVLTEESEISHKKLLGDETSIGLTTREYIVSSDIQKQKIRKISWKLQKAAGRMLDQCREGKVNFKEIKKDARRLYALLNVAGLDFNKRQNQEYVPEFDFPRKYQKRKIGIGGTYGSSTLNITSESGDDSTNLTTSSYAFGGEIEKIFNYKNTWNPIGIHLNAGFEIKNSSSSTSGIESTNNTLINFETGPAFGINESSYLSILLSYHQDDYLNTNTTNINGFEKGSVISTKYMLDKIFNFGLDELHAKVFYQTNLSTPSFSDVYTTSSNLGLVLDYGNIFAETRYRFKYESESYFNVSDTRTDVKMSGALIYLF